MLLVLLLVLVGCTRADRGERTSPAEQGPAGEVRLGYFPNITHAGALVGVERGLFTAELGATELVPVTFNDGGAAVNALLGESLDIAFIGPGPAINAYAKSDGEAVKLVAGATSGGAQLVVKPGIDRPQQLIGRTIATPALGNTQDIALKKWLAATHLTDAVEVTNVESARALDAFTNGQIDGAWLPEPWSSRLVLEAGGHVLVDERSQWPGGEFPSTVVVVRTPFLQSHPETVRAVLRGLVRAEQFAAQDPARAKQDTNAHLLKATGRALPTATTERAFANIRLTTDPNAAAFEQLARDAVAAGVLKAPIDLAGFVEPGPLHAVLSELGLPTSPQRIP
ncbi:ABC transporter substrate-binding protein [Saccharothrix sp. S26]|uniref:ABC transporter substrate-binding protein n=1 Tax=Saccharothrix sp. S26 TaxID=2907215 RepID=UPI001F2D57B4|nr:ABC transporter substrate-binding protein [Saccharothrix sp. S26]